VQSALRATDGDLPAAIRAMDDVVAATLGRPRLYVLLTAAFGGLALVLAVVGIAGLVSYAAAQRTREIGIRVALGARRTDILKLVVSQGMYPVLAGLIAGAGAALFAARFLRALLYDLEPSDPATYAAVLGLLTTIALAACWLPARRAARADPIAALRAG
jgi:ABC-type antimicrobial peptide transport system permease subunit